MPKLNYSSQQSMQEHLFRQLLGTTSSLNNLLCRLQDQFDRQQSDQITALESSLAAVARSGETQRIVGANPDRVAVWICNASDKNLLIGPQSLNVSANLYSAVIKPNETLKLTATDNRLYKEGIDGVWEDLAAAESAAMITEFFPSDDAEGSNPIAYDQ